MKFIYQSSNTSNRYVFFQAPPEGNFGPPEWHDPKKAKELALKNLRGAKDIGIENENLLLCLQQLELFIEGELDYALTSDDQLARELFIETFYAESAIGLLALFNSAFISLNTREDFDLTDTGVEDYFGGFLYCLVEALQD